MGGNCCSKRSKVSPLNERAYGENIVKTGRKHAKIRFLKSPEILLPGQIRETTSAPDALHTPSFNNSEKIVNNMSISDSVSRSGDENMHLLEAGGPLVEEKRLCESTVVLPQNSSTVVTLMSSCQRFRKRIPIEYDGKMDNNVKSFHNNIPKIDVDFEGDDSSVTSEFSSESESDVTEARTIGSQKSGQRSWKSRVKNYFSSLFKKTAPLHRVEMVSPKEIARLSTSDDWTTDSSDFESQFSSDSDDVIIEEIMNSQQHIAEETTFVTFANKAVQVDMYNERWSSPLSFVSFSSDSEY